MFAFYTIEGLALTLVFSSCGPLLSTFILVTFGLINQEGGGEKHHYQEKVEWFGPLLPGVRTRLI